MSLDLSARFEVKSQSDTKDHGQPKLSLSNAEATVRTREERYMVNVIECINIVRINVQTYTALVCP